MQESEVLKGLASRLRSECGAQLGTVETPHSSIGCDVVRLASPIAVAANAAVASELMALLIVYDMKSHVSRRLEIL